MPDEFCPKCGDARIGAFRFCRSCGHDHDDFEAEPASTAEPSGWIPAPRGRPTLRHVAIGVAIVLGLGALSNVAGGGTGAPIATSLASQAADASPTEAAPSTQASVPIATQPPLGLAPTGPTEEGRVVRVIDGDTIVVEIAGVEYRVRYIGMDTPESVDPNSPVEPMALASSAANEALVAGKAVLLEKDVSDTDRYGRLLRNVWVEREGALVLVGLELVRTGFAQVSTYPPDVMYVDALLSAEVDARTAAVGLWASDVTPVATTTPVATAAPVTVVSDETLSITTGERVAYRGVDGSYTWTSVAFDSAQVIVRWDVTAAAAACRVAWQVKPVGSDVLKSTVRVDASGREKGVERYDTPFSHSVVTVSSTCPTWLLTMEGNEPPAAGGGGSNCHPPYSPCLPIVGDLDCPDVRAMGKAPVTVKGPDEYRLDRDGNGIGCE